MKINWSYLKKPSVIIGGIVLFFVLLFLLNRSSSTSAAVTQTGATGPSDAQVAAQTQLALAQLSAGIQTAAISEDYAKSQDTNASNLALAQVAAALQTQQIAASQETSDRSIDANVHGMDLQYQGLVNQNATALAAAQAQYAYGLASQAINANTTIQLSQQQLEAYKTMTGAQLVSSLVGHNTYASIALPAYFGTAPENAPNGSHGMSAVNVISPITNLF